MRSSVFITGATSGFGEACARRFAAAGWALALSDRLVAAYPSPARSYESEGLGSLPIVFCQRDTGALVQRVLFDSPVTALAVRMAPGSVVVATQEEGWALGRRPSMDGDRAGR